jgi:hypothetical protein
LAKISNIQNRNYDCIEADWQEYMDYFSEPNPSNANDRSWLYQTCTEFGFYQTCPADSNCPYANGYHNVDRDLELCQEAFGISPDDVPTSIQSTLEYYGGWDLSPSSEAMESSNASSGPHLLSSNGDEQRIMFVNGDVDPWSELAVSDGTRVPGSSHHFWTHKIKHSDGDAIAAARQEIYDTISSWLGVEPSSLTAVE